MSTYGLSLHFDGYPVIDTANLVSLYPLGTYFTGQYTDRFGYAGFSGAHPRSAPAGATVYCNATPYGKHTLIDGITLNNSAIYGTLYGYKERAASIGVWADCRNVASSNNYGLMFSDKGVNTALAHGGLGAMRVIARRTYTIPAGNCGSKRVFSIPELQRDLRGHQDIAVFIGVRTRAFTPIGKLEPISYYAGGAKLSIRLMQSSVGNGAWVSENYSFDYGGNNPALTLYVMVCAAPTTVIGSSYGFAMYNDSGKVVMSQNNVPVFGKGYFYTMPVATRPSGWAGVQTLSAALQGSKLIMMPVGGNVKGIFNYVEKNSDTITIGQQTCFFEGNTVKSAFVVTQPDYYYPTTLPNSGYMIRIGAKFSNSRYMTSYTPVMLVNGDEYFL